MRGLAKSAALTVIIMAIVGTSPLEAGWTEDGAPICTDTLEQRYPQIAADGIGGAYMTWADHRPYPDIFAQRVDHYGRRYWQLDGIGVCTASRGQYGPMITADGSGGAIIAWYDDRDAGNKDVYAQKVDGNGNFLWTAQGVAVCTASGNQGGVAICSDGAGGCVIAWLDFRNGSYEDVYAQRLDPDGNPLWNPDGVAICTADLSQMEIDIAPDGNHGAVIVWEDYRSGGNIYAQRIAADGTVKWAADGAGICTLPGNHYEPDIIYDELGGTIMTWQDYRTGSFYEIYAQRVDSLGNAIWTANGTPICIDPDWQGRQKLAPCGPGGAIIAWYDNRGSAGDIYAQRIGPDGSVKWQSNGVPICAADGSAGYPCIIADGSMGAVIAWQDARSATTGNDIYAQRVDSNGVYLWTENGDSLCTAASSQINPRIAPDGTGGGIVVWEDNRELNYDIYSMRINGDGDFIATLLQSSSAGLDGSSVKLEWTLAEAGSGMQFHIARKTLPGGEFEALPPGVVSGNDLSFSYRDGTALPGETYIYRIDVSDEDGWRTLFESSPISVPPAVAMLFQNHPNPFNPVTTIRYSIPERCFVTLEIFDVSGRRVARLIEEEQPRGDYTFEWNGMEGSGGRAVSGVYLYRLKAGKQTLTRKMVLLR